MSDMAPSQSQPGFGGAAVVVDVVFVVVAAVVRVDVVDVGLVVVCMEVGSGDVDPVGFPVVLVVVVVAGSSDGVGAADVPNLQSGIPSVPQNRQKAIPQPPQPIPPKRHSASYSAPAQPHSPEGGIVGTCGGASMSRNCWPQSPRAPASTTPLEIPSAPWNLRDSPACGRQLMV